jgi:pimeloyl-ACP methyl ester carboxylesterase
VPLDYDEPNGAQVELALLKVPARDPQEKVGSLFVNPGGPGASARSFALEFPSFFGSEVLDHFDIIGMDPRGVGGSEQVRCFDTFEERLAAWAGHLSQAGPPWTQAKEEEEMESARAVGRGCSTNAQPLIDHMSTAEVARDMDVVRRAVGDPKLNYYGASYGSYLGEVYANMFPDRVRAMNIDGDVEPLAWVGSPQTRFDPVFDRLRSADGAYKALIEILHRCAAVGQPTCKFGGGDPVAKFAVLANRLKTEAVPVELGGYGEIPPLGTVAVDYGWLIQATHYFLEFPTGWESIDAMLSSLWTLTGEGTGADPSATAVTAARRSLRRSLTAAYRAAMPSTLEAGPEVGTALTPEEEALESAMSFEESLKAVECTDTRYEPPDVSVWRVTGAFADRRAPYFGSFWNYVDTPCARSTWTASDPDAYYGPFDRHTANPVLITSNYWDPSTNYDSGVAVWKMMPGSRLISADSWGHASYWTTRCIGDVVDQYLITATPPPLLTHCKGDVQPFEPAATGSILGASGYVPRISDIGLPVPERDGGR